jgi:hypothetical protein
MRITRSWALPLGAVKPLLAPSWLMALPRMTASTSCPCRCASPSRSSSTIPAPSEGTVPSAVAANDLQRPSAARPPAWPIEVNVIGVARTVTPPANAIEHSRARSERHARWTVTSEDEHAVSTVIAGPRRPST